MSVMDRLARRLRWLRIPKLMNYLVAGMAVVWIADLTLPALGVGDMLALDMSLVARGQVWRLVTFVIEPPDASLLWIVFTLYFDWLIGTALERQWGSQRFTLFYLTGMLGAILAALITGKGSNSFLNLSLFFAFAAVWPDYEILLFFLLPVKMKYLALLDAALYVWQLFVGTWPTRAALLLSLLNVALFLGGDLLAELRKDSGYWKTRRNFRRAMKK